MNPSANSSGVPGPIFSGDSAPVPPAETPPAGTPTPTTDPVFTPKNDDIILQPSQPAKNPALQKYKKPLIIVGIVLAVVICVLLIISAVSKKSNNDSAEMDEAVFYESSLIFQNFNLLMNRYQDNIGLSPTSSIFIETPQKILFTDSSTYTSMKITSDALIESFSEIITNTGKTKYNKPVIQVVTKAKPIVEKIQANVETIQKLHQAFIIPIQSSENWRHNGCVDSAEAKALLNDSDKKLAAIAKQYHELTCANPEVEFSSGNSFMPQSVDAKSLALLNQIAGSLSSYLQPINDSSQEIFEEMSNIVVSTNFQLFSDDETEKPELNESDENNE